MKKFIFALSYLLIASQILPVDAQSQGAYYRGGFYPTYNKEKLYTIEGHFKGFSIRKAGGGVSIEVNGEEKFYEASKSLTIENKINLCFDSPVPKYDIQCKTWPRVIQPDAFVRVTYWVMTPPGMHEDGIATDIQLVRE